MRPTSLRRSGVAWKAAHNASSGGIGNNISIAPGCTARVVLQWSNPFGRATTRHHHRSDERRLISLHIGPTTGTEPDRSDQHRK
jgi:hypothetical protein